MRQTNKKTYRQKQRQTERNTDGQKDRQTYRQTDGQKDGNLPDDIKRKVSTVQVVPPE